MNASWLWLWSFECSINLRIEQIPTTNHHFSCEKSLLLCGSRFLKKNIIFSGCYYRQANRKKLIFFRKNTLKNWRTWSYVVPVHNFLSHLQFFKVLMLPAGYISSISIEVNKTVFVLHFFYKKILSILSIKKSTSSNFHPYNIHKQKHFKKLLSIQYVQIKAPQVTFI